jgi:CheY-like chemotaxis protein
VAHDFNNLLGVIVGYRDLVLRQELAPQFRHKVEQIRKAGDRAATLTRQLLAFSRKQVIAPKVLDLHALVVEFARMLPRVLGEDIELVIEQGPHLGHVKADPGQIEQILMNLGVNARDAMPEGGRITIATRNVTVDRERFGGGDPAGSFVMLSMSDDGSGMDEVTRSRVFEPFFTTKPMGEGTGLGLATVYGIVKQSGGYIWLRSEAGRGSVFEIYLPVVGGTPSGRPLHDSMPVAVAGETILLVEDEADVRSILSRVLREQGYLVLEAPHGRAALELAAEPGRRVDLVVADVVMPQMLGKELVERNTATRPDIRVLYMTGYAQPVLASQGTLDADVALIEKPFTKSQLLTALRHRLAAPS